MALQLPGDHAIVFIVLPAAWQADGCLLCDLQPCVAAAAGRFVSSIWFSRVCLLLKLHLLGYENRILIEVFGLQDGKFPADVTRNHSTRACFKETVPNAIPL